MLSYLNFIREKLIPNVDYFPSKTSMNQIAYGLKLLIKLDLVKSGDINLDYGGGKYEKGTDFLYSYGVTNLVYDKYSRSEIHNKSVIDKLKNKKADSVTLLNVLNVIQDQNERIEVIKDAYSFLKDGGVMVITVYKGFDKHHVKPELTKSKTWQENRPLDSYLYEIKLAIPDSDPYISKKAIFINKNSNLNESFKLRTEKGSIIKRSRYGVGKSIGGHLYFHKNYINDIPIIDKKLINNIIDKLPKNFIFNIIKYPENKNGYISFINSPDFDENSEPIIYDYYTYKDDKLIYTPAKKKKQIYHHKWLFVKDDYKGFDVEESKNRSANWLSIKNIDFSKIGYQDYWFDEVLPKLKESLNDESSKHYSIGEYVICKNLNDILGVDIEISKFLMKNIGKIIEYHYIKGEITFKVKYNKECKVIGWNEFYLKPEYIEFSSKDKNEVEVYLLSKKYNV